MKSEDMLERLERGWKVFDFNLLDNSFENLKLDGIKFECNRLDNVSFKGSSLIGAKFFGVILNDCNFEGADLTGSDWELNTCSNTNFSKAIFDRTRFVKFKLLENLNFRKARFQEAEVRGKFESCNFKKTDFTGSNLSQISFPNSILEDTNFSDCVLKTHLWAEDCLKNAIIGKCITTNAKMTDFRGECLLKLLR
jgi:uncharacterized protein YjbI with pentapeptide repeats